MLHAGSLLLDHGWSNVFVFYLGNGAIGYDTGVNGTIVTLTIVA